MNQNLQFYCWLLFSQQFCFLNKDSIWFSWKIDSSILKSLDLICAALGVDDKLGQRPLHLAAKSKVELRVPFPENRFDTEIKSDPKIIFDTKIKSHPNIRFHTKIKSGPKIKFHTKIHVHSKLELILDILEHPKT